MGIEYDERIFSGAMENREMAVSGARTCFVKADAGEYSVPKEVDRCYFFNPFSIEILQKVLARIYESFYEHPREIQLLFYYPADAYVSYLMTEEQLMFSDEIDCMDLFEGENPREKILTKPTTINGFSLVTILSDERSGLRMSALLHGKSEHFKAAYPLRRGNPPDERKEGC